MKKIIALTGAGISAESGVPTFRDANGLWEGHDIMEVATPEAWERNPALVLEFYNQRRKAALNVNPNKGHLALAALEKHFEVTVITQNVDNLHEKAGSSRIIHLHGELFKCRSTCVEEKVLDMEGWELNLGDCCEKGTQLRPHIVWFGEAVPMMEVAMEETLSADIFLVIGTSLLVYPAAGLIDFVGDEVPKYVIDPMAPRLASRPNLHLLPKKAGEGVPEVAEKLIRQYGG